MRALYQIFYLKERILKKKYFLKFNKLEKKSFSYIIY
jgi:hypothetical protein